MSRMSDPEPRGISAAGPAAEIPGGRGTGPVSVRGARKRNMQAEAVGVMS